MNITGTIIELYDTVQVSDKFKKREFVIQDNENPQYPQYIKFELAQDKCALLDAVSMNDQVDVSFNVRGRSYVNPQGVKSYFNSLQAWKIQTIGKGGNAPGSYSGGEAVNSNLPAEDDGLPF